MDPLPPNLSLPHPKTTFWNPSSDSAPAHMMHGSHVTYSTQRSNPAASVIPCVSRVNRSLECCSGFEFFQKDETTCSATKRGEVGRVHCDFLTGRIRVIAVVCEKGIDCLELGVPRAL
jgi:hypothetical protein